MIEKPASVRYATPEDEDGVMALCRLQAEENAMFDVEEDLLRMAVRRALRFDRTILGVIGERGDLRGGLMIFVGNPWYSDQVVLQELFNFVHPDHRQNTTYAYDLIDFGKHLSDKMQLTLHIGVISNTRTEAKVRMYKKKLHYVGAFFNYNGTLGRDGDDKEPHSIAEKPASIRYPGVDEEDDIMRLCMMEAEENATTSFDPEKIRIAVKRSLALDRTILGVIGERGKLEAGIMVFVGQPWYSQRPILQELFSFVHPDHRRGTNHANDLIDFAKHVSDKMNIHLQIGIVSNIRTEAKVRLYRRRLNCIGAYFDYNSHLGVRPAEQNSQAA